MKVAAIIAEYNPFHNGHAYQLQKVRELSGADFIIALMSGDWVQRGEPAIVDKYIRTEMALSCGADLVLELPLAAATGSAGDFALGAVAILEKLGCVDELWFGGESDDMEMFESVSEILAEEPPAYIALLRKYMSEGKNFPAAREMAITEMLTAGMTFENVPAEKAAGVENAFGVKKTVGKKKNIGEKELRAFLRGSNNILGLEYCLAIRKIENAGGEYSTHPIRPHVLKRNGDAYKETRLQNTFASAMAIRQAMIESEALQGLTKERRGELLTGADDICKAWERQIPSKVFPLLAQYIEERGILVPEDFSDMLSYQLLREDKESITRYKDISQDLGNRLIAAGASFTTLPEFAGLVKTRNKTQTAVQRALVHILLQLSDDREKLLDPHYVRVLGFSQESGVNTVKVQSAQADAVKEQSAQADSAKAQKARTDAVKTQSYRTDAVKAQRKEKNIHILPAEDEASNRSGGDAATDSATDAKVGQMAENVKKSDVKRLLHAIKKKGQIRLVTKASRLKGEDSGEEIFAAELYEMTRARKKGDEVRPELSRSLCIVEG